ncbi:MAG TPA: SEC-C domain-containing protein [Thermoanaerobaculia bacterium]
MSLASWFRNLFASATAKPEPVEVGRNDLCWCGSGKKYKKCHLKSDETNRVEARYAAQAAAAQARKAGIVPGGKSGKGKQRLERAAEPPAGKR